MQNTDTSSAGYQFDHWEGDVADPNDPNNPQGPSYVFSGLDPDTAYRFRLKARDKADNPATTGWSDWYTFRTAATPDITPPLPSPLTWDTATDANGYDGRPRRVWLDQTTYDFGYGATMRATVATDQGTVTTPPVEYYFDCNRDDFDSGWITDVTYTVLTGSDPALYGLTFRVRARDQAHNMTDWSEWVAVENRPPATGGAGGAGGGTAAVGAN